MVALRGQADGLDSGGEGVQWRNGGRDHHGFGNHGGLDGDDQCRQRVGRRGIRPQVQGIEGFDSFWRPTLSLSFKDRHAPAVMIWFNFTEGQGVLLSECLEILPPTRWYSAIAKRDTSTSIGYMFPFIFYFYFRCRYQANGYMKYFGQLFVAVLYIGLITFCNVLDV